MNITYLTNTFLFGISSFLVLTSCSSQVERDGPPGHIPDSVQLDRIDNPTPRFSPHRPANQKPYTIHGQTYYPLSSNQGFVQRGEASWYGRKFHGRPTATGEIYDMYAMTAAHKRLPLPSYVSVTNLDNERQIIVRVNDRGPFHGNRIIDLSYAAAYKLGILQHGTGSVEIRAITPDTSIEHVPHALPPAPEEKNVVVYLQVGAFRHYENAQRLQQRLQNHLNWPIRIVSTANNQIHRVETGPLPQVSKAEQIAEQLTQHGISDAQVRLAVR
ncbi:MAG: septal ring lytic transglycosylase RlpA family protein [Pseudomonadota bacterium]